jgi:heme/copper-type cytochrome/quinol oxidase subunit 4
MSSNTEHQDGLGKYIVVYVVMLAITGIELLIASRHPAGTVLLASMLILAFLGAALGILYFMHLATENRASIVAFTLFTLFVLAATTYGWSDSFRLLFGVPFAK